MSSLSLRGIKKDLGGNPILRGVDLEVGDGELVVLVGPSGCGKSTLLRTIAGLEIPDHGTLKIGERDVTQLPPRDRDVAMVFQSYALYPHLTVRENLGFGLKLRGTDAKTIAERVDEVAQMLGLEKLLDRYPRQMSGGQRQRVAMGRAIARRPSVFLFDEPLSNLDAALRADVRVEIKRLHARLKEQGQGATMIYVTHDQVEAMTLADRLVVLKSGHVEQIGAPLEVYAKPRSRFVASFLGSPAMNFVPGEIVDGRIRADGLDAQLPQNDRIASKNVLAGVRPHDVLPSANGHADILLRVEVIEAMGFEAYAHGKVGAHPFVARLEGDRARAARPGDTLALDIAQGSLHLFDPDSERTLS
ncbi:ABC transporter ATP-binding protein [Sandaracinus amylolyticus]|uniref:ABC transporter ATP-binding protein n=1 Tax=Sandaracinus amylolyticus TaxID=927083 RepID=UPI001F02A96F|nr:ABC-type sugar transport systems ATPase component [Sandaracinus amylolyticus]